MSLLYKEAFAYGLDAFADASITKRKIVLPNGERSEYYVSCTGTAFIRRDKDYRKKPLSNRIKRMYNMVYKKYPNLLKTMYSRPNKYNEIYNKIERLENEEKIFVFRPRKKVDISRLERNKDKLKELYEEGTEEAKNRLQDLKDYLSS